MTITVERIKKEIEHLERLQIAGVKRDPISLGQMDILWVVYDGGREEWELLPRWMAELVVSDLHNFPEVRRACLYRTPPQRVPMSVFALWLSANRHLPST